MVSLTDSKLGPRVLAIYHGVWREASSRRLLIVGCKNNAREVLNPVVVEIIHIAADIATHALIRIYYIAETNDGP